MMAAAAEPSEPIPVYTGPTKTGTALIAAVAAEAEKQTMSVKYYSRERIAALLKDVYATPPELIKKVKDAMVQ